MRDPRTGQTQTADVKTLDGGYDFSTSVIMPMAQTLMQSGFYYATLLEGGELFIQYNLCQDNPQMPMADFAKALREQLAGMQRPEKILVDLRNNGGGNQRGYPPAAGSPFGTSESGQQNLCAHRGSNVFLRGSECTGSA